MVIETLRHTALGFFFCPGFGLPCQAYPNRGFYMRMIGLTLIFVCCFAQMTAESSVIQPAPIVHATSLSIAASFPHVEAPEFIYATPQRWAYLRKGLNYLESPKPLSFPESVPPTYIHPDSKGFGAYGFSPGAYSDVQRLYPFFKKYSWQDILGSTELYDLANQAFADCLLKNLQAEIPQNAANAQIFDVLHKAWNLGLSGYRKGRSVVSSRIRRAEEFKSGAML
jgi:hypothetical protein